MHYEKSMFIGEKKTKYSFIRSFACRHFYLQMISPSPIATNASSTSPTPNTGLGVDNISSNSSNNSSATVTNHRNKPTMIRLGCTIVSTYLQALTFTGCIVYSIFLSSSAALLMLEVYIPQYFADRLNGAYVFYLIVMYDAASWVALWMRRCFANIRARGRDRSMTPKLAPGQLGTLLTLSTSSWILDVARITSLRLGQGSAVYSLAPLSTAVLAAVIAANWMHHSGLLTVTQTVRYCLRTIWLLTSGVALAWALYYQLELQWYEVALVLVWTTCEVLVDLLSRQLDQASTATSSMPSCICIGAPATEMLAASSSSSSSSTPIIGTAVFNQPTNVTQRSSHVLGDRWLRLTSVNISAINTALIVCAFGTCASVMGVLLFDVDRRETLVGMFDTSAGNAAGGIVILMVVIRVVVELSRLELYTRVPYCLRPTGDPIWRSLLTTMAIYLLLPPNYNTDIAITVLLTMCVLIFVCVYGSLSLMDFVQDYHQRLNAAASVLTSDDDDDDDDNGGDMAPAVRSTTTVNSEQRHHVLDS
jgi:hypothetical protein